MSTLLMMAALIFMSWGIEGFSQDAFAARFVCQIYKQFVQWLDLFVGLVLRATIIVYNLLPLPPLNLPDPIPSASELVLSDVYAVWASISGRDSPQL